MDLIDNWPLVLAGLYVLWLASRAIGAFITAARAHARLALLQARDAEERWEREMKARVAREGVEDEISGASAEPPPPRQQPPAPALRSA
jgi:hypothetical protein